MVQVMGSHLSVIYASGMFHLIISFLRGVAPPLWSYVKGMNRVEAKQNSHSVMSE